MKKLLLTTLLATTCVISAADAGSDSIPKSISSSQLQSIAGAVTDDKVPSWFKRIEIDANFGGGSPQWGVLTVQPIWQTKDKKHTFFTQLSAFSTTDFGDNRTTTNAGLGYRHLLMDDALLLGANVFYDHEWRFNHQRASVGVEVRSIPIEFTANAYNAFSNRRTIVGTVRERALSGWDAEIGLQVPYLPWAKMFAKEYTWNGVAGGDIDGHVQSLRMKPISWLEIEAGRDDRGDKVDGFAKVAVKWPFGNEEQQIQPLVDDRPFAFGDSMVPHVLEKVRRTNKIVVERTSGTGGTFSVSVSRGS